MKQVQCPECGNIFSENVNACPNCGYPNDSLDKREIDECEIYEEENANKRKWLFVALVFLFTMAFVSVWFLLSKNDTNNSEEAERELAKAQAAKAKAEAEAESARNRAEEAKAQVAHYDSLATAKAYANDANSTEEIDNYIINHSSDESRTSTHGATSKNNSSNNSGYSSGSPNQSSCPQEYTSTNERELRILARLKELEKMGKSLVYELAYMRNSGRMDPANYMFIKQTMLGYKQEQISLARQLGDYQLASQYQQQYQQLELAYSMLENGY